MVMQLEDCIDCLTIKQEEGYLGPYLHQLNVGDIQKMNFTPDDSGPFWMTPEEKESARHDITDAAKKKIRKYTRMELKQKLLEKKYIHERKPKPAVSHMSKQWNSCGRRDKSCR